MKLKLRRNQGLTLIELMIVLAVLGVLLAILVPALKEGSTKKKVVEAMSSVQVLQSVVEHNAKQGNGNLAQGSQAIRPTRLVKSMTVTNTATGELEVRFGEELNHASVVLVPYTGSASAPSSLNASKKVDSAIQWACKAAGSGFPLGASASLAKEVAPNECQ